MKKMRTAIILGLNFLCFLSYAQEPIRIQHILTVKIGDEADQLYYKPREADMHYYPNIIGCRDEEIFVDDTNHERVVIYDKSITKIAEIPYRGRQEFLFPQPPVAMDKDKAGNYYFMFWKNKIVKTDTKLSVLFQVKYAPQMLRLNSGRYFLLNEELFFFNKEVLNFINKKGDYFDEIETFKHIENKAGWGKTPFTDDLDELAQVMKKKRIYYYEEKLICTDYYSFIDFKSSINSQKSFLYKDEKKWDGEKSRIDYLGHDKFNNIYWYNMRNPSIVLVYDKYCRLIEVLEYVFPSKPVVDENGDLYYIQSTYEGIHFYKILNTWSKKAENVVQSPPVIGSTSYIDYQSKYTASRVFDNNLETAWLEGVAGPGIGESITIEFPNPVSVDRIEFMPGYFDEQWFAANNRVRRLKITLDGKTRYVNFVDVMRTQAIEFKEEEIFTKAEFKIVEVYPGKDDDTAISEISFFYKGKPVRVDLKK